MCYGQFESLILTKSDAYIFFFFLDTSANLGLFCLKNLK